MVLSALMGLALQAAFAAPSELPPSPSALDAAAMQTPIYQESLRPQVHFTPRTGWTNDPNGLVYFKREYHLFFQHNPFGTEWGNMTWGHAVSKDLVHWLQLDEAIRPDGLGTIFSGSAVVDKANTAGFGTKSKPPLVCIYTAAGGTNPESKGQPFTQCLAYSLDGRTFTKYTGNPVLQHIAGENRDPKVIWHAPTQRWIMALYLVGDRYALFQSPDLRNWTKLCEVPMPGCGECPDFFEMKVERRVEGWKGGRVEVGLAGKGVSEPVTPDPPHIHTSTPPHSDRTLPPAVHPSTPPSSPKKWVFWAANGRYRVGSFDGKTFKPETDVLQADWGPNSYAAQTYSDAPGGRRIQISWMQGGRYPGMPFNQQMSFPREMTLRDTPEGPRLCMAPVREIAKLRGKRFGRKGLAAALGVMKLPVRGDGFEIRLESDGLAPGRFTLAFRGARVEIETAKGILRCLGKEVHLPKTDGRFDATILVDRTSVEVFACGGRVTMAGCFLPDLKQDELTLTFDGHIMGRDNTVFIGSLDVWELKSIW